MKLRKITETDLQGVGVVGMADTPNLSARQMQEKVEEVVRAVVIPVINENIDYTATKQDLADAVYNAGAGDMQAVAYDSNLDGIVNCADNGLFVYTHSSDGLTGSGTNGKFKAAVTGIYTAIKVNGISYGVKCGEDTEIDLVAGAWYTFILDGNTINFKQGGAGLNLKIVGSRTQPASPKENTIWVNTDIAIGVYQFCVTEPTTRADGTPLQNGDVWIKTGVNGSAEINVVKKNSLVIYPQSCMQWNGSEWIAKDVKVYKNGEWLALKIWFLQGGEQYSEVTGGWAVIDTPSGAHQSATIGSDGITFATTSYISREIATVSPIDFTSISALYFSVPSISNISSTNNGRCLSVGINQTRTHTWKNNASQGWLVENFINNPQAATNILYTLDTSSVNTECYILAVTGCGSDTTMTVVIDEIYGV